MGHIKRYPQLKREHHAHYEKISKADLVEAYRDLFRQTFGVELDDEEWMNDLQERVELLKHYRTGRYTS